MKMWKQSSFESRVSKTKTKQGGNSKWKEHFSLKPAISADGQPETTLNALTEE
jgi:hypothetical protein